MLWMRRVKYLSTWYVIAATVLVEIMLAIWPKPIDIEDKVPERKLLFNMRCFPLVTIYSKPIAALNLSVFILNPSEIIDHLLFCLSAYQCKREQLRWVKWRSHRFLQRRKYLNQTGLERHCINNLTRFCGTRETSYSNKICLLGNNLHCSCLPIISGNKM